MKRVIVVGAGVSGLALAHALQGRAEVRVLDAAPRAGGLLGTTRRDGYLLEHAASSVQDTGGDFVALARDLGVDLVAASPRARARFVVHRGRPKALPASNLHFLASPLLPLGAKFRVLRERRVPPGGSPGETIAGFTARRFGPGVADLVDAFVTGVYGGDPAALAVAHAFPDLVAMEREHGSLLRAMRARKASGAARPTLVAPRDGMGALVDALAQEVQPELGRSVRAVRARAGGGFEVETAGATLAADAVALAVPPLAAARLLDDKSLLAAAERVPVAPVAVVGLGYPAENFRGKGLGVLAPEREGRTILGALFESNAFPGRAPAGHALLRVLVGGARHPERAALPERALVEAAHADLALLGLVRGEPAFSCVWRPPGGIPQPVAGHEVVLAEAERAARERPGLALLGAGYHTVAVAKLLTEARHGVAAMLPYL